MSELVHNQYKGWMEKLHLKGAFIATDGTLTLTADATDDDMRETAGVLYHQRDAFTKLGWLTDRWLGELILSHSTKHDCTWKESIEALHLCEKDGRSMRSLSRLPRIVSRLPVDVLSLPLTTKHFDAATEVMTPEGDQTKWLTGVREILVEAAKDPEETSSRDVSAKVKALQTDCGVPVTEKQSTAAFVKALIEAAYLHYNPRPGVDPKKTADFLLLAFNDAFARGIATDPDSEGWECPKHLKKDPYE